MELDHHGSLHLIAFLLSRLWRRRRRKRGWFDCLRGGIGGRGGRRMRHTCCNFMEIHLFFHFSKSVSIWYQSFHHCLLQFQCLYHRMVHAVKEVKAVLNNQNPSARFSNVSLFSDTTSSTSSSSSGIGLEAFISIKQSSVNPYAVVSINSYISPTSISPFTFTPCLFCMALL